MSGLIWTLIFGVAYPLMTLVCACAGTFGIAATKPERVAEAKRRQQYPDSDKDGFFFRIAYAPMLWDDIWRVIAVSLFWPIGVPMYLAWKKGRFIAATIEQRDTAKAELGRAA